MTYLLANFGGPRHINEVQSFLTSLLTDRDVTGHLLPSWLHHPLFKYIAKKRTNKVSPQYAAIGGYSPIYQDTETLSSSLSQLLQTPVFTLHRYLIETHSHTLSQLQTLHNTPVIGMPLFPHFTYAVTGSIVRFIHTHLPDLNISWIPHFGEHPQFISCMANFIQSFLLQHHLPQEDTCVIFSSHGLPLKYVKQGDPYQNQCEASFHALANQLPDLETHLCYQSKFGPGEWLKPSTKTLCETLKTTRSHVLIVPFGFTSDHIETLYEIEKIYIPILQKRYHAMRVPAIHQSPQWINTLIEIMQTSPKVPGESLIKPN